MTETPSKTHRDENFPVASVLVAPQHRATIMAYYQFARAADDVADSPSLTSDAKLAGLDRFEATLLGRSDAEPAALPLRAALAKTKLAPRHALDLLQAFRMDSVQGRYPDWDALMNYCAYSAAPVGRFVLDVHGESEATWPASDALCSALQIINHLQDCAADYRNLDRVYLPLDVMARHGIGVEALSAPYAAPGLRACLRELTEKTALLVAQGVPLPAGVRDWRLCLETAVIGRLAHQLIGFLRTRDPLSEKVHLSKPAALGWAVVGAVGGLRSRLRRGPALPAPRMGGV